MQKCTSSNSNHRSQIEHKPLPFRKVVESHFTKLKPRITQLPQLYSICSRQAVNQIEEHLQQVIARQLSRPLYLDFNIFRSINKAERLEETGDNQYLYQRFIDDINQKGLSEWLAQNPGLKQRLKQICDREISNVQRVLKRLHQNRKKICRTFDISDSKYVVKELKFGLSDPHKGRQTVIEITFEGNSKIIYKPRSIEAEHAWNRFLNWINKHSLDLSFKTVKIVSYNSHGYMEYVEPTACETAQEVSNYYKRLGAICTLSHFFGSTDLHAKNLVACGEHPVIIDLETLLPVAPSITDTPAGITKSGLIPSDITSISDSGIESSVLGLGIHPDQKMTQKCWDRINTDKMDRIDKEKQWESQQSLPRLKNAIQSPLTYFSNLIDGMKQMNQFLCAHLDTLTADFGPLTVFRNIRQRFLMRSSQTYADLLYDLRAARYQNMQSELNKVLGKLEVFYQHVSSAKKQGYKQLVDYEKKALVRGDIPYISIRASSTAFTCNGISVDGIIDIPPYRMLRQNIEQVKQEDFNTVIDSVIGAISDFRSAS